MSWARILMLETRLTFFTLICCKICLKRPKIYNQEAEVGPFKKRRLNLI